MIVARGKRAHLNKTIQAEEMAKQFESRLKPLEEVERKPEDIAAKEIRSFVAEQAATKALSTEDVQSLERRLESFPIIIEFEALPGAPFYRTKVVGCSIVISLNTEHAFYEKVYRRIQAESPIAKTGVDLGQASAGVGIPSNGKNGAKISGYFLGKSRKSIRQRMATDTNATLDE
jgi:hypothetical protein